MDCGTNRTEANKTGDFKNSSDLYGVWDISPWFTVIPNIT